MSDDGLREALAADLNGAFEGLVLAYQDRLYAFALRFTGCAPDAEEVAQDAFMRAYRALATYPQERVQALELRPWLFQITLNVARNRVRRSRARFIPLDAVGVTPSHEPEADGRERPDARLEQSERSHRLAALLAALPARYRAAVALRHVHGLSYGEIAAVVAQPVGTVKSDVHRGVKLLRAALDGDLEQYEEVAR